MIQKGKAALLILFRLLKNAMTELLKNDPLRMAGATAFFTTFALPPILVIMIQSLKLVLDPEKIRDRLFNSLSGIIGKEAVDQLTDVLMALRKLAQNWWIIIGGFIFLCFVATTLFKVIKSSINQVWKIRPVHKQGIVRTLSSRLQSIGVILVAGILFMIGLLAEGMQAFIGKYIFEISPLLSAYYNSVLNYIISIIVETMWFVIVFRYLPDGRPQWRVAFAGGFLTALLFTIGKVVLHWLLSYSNITTLYGTSASIVLLLLFVFYSALILYYGAAFTKVWGLSRDQPIRPLPHAMHYRLIEAEHDEKNS
jgi:membrane protein